MSGEARRPNLGRGLSALLGGESGDYAELDKPRTFTSMPIEHLHPSRYQPRHQVDPEQIDDLALSIREKGILQPLLVRRHPEKADAFEIIAGERRWRAAQLAKLHQVPVIVKEFSDQEALEVALVENVQRQDLSPLEEAEGYNQLMEEFSHTQENLARAVGKSRSHVANMMRLLGLPGPVKEMLNGGVLSAGHARALLNADDPLALARRVADLGLNVRQTEKLVRDAAAKAKTPRQPRQKDADTIALERDLTNLMGLKVEIDDKGGKGSLKVHYKTLEQLDDILNRLSHGAHGAGSAAKSSPATPDEA